MKRNPKRTLLAWLLTAAMLLSLLPSAAFAAFDEAAEEETAAEQVEESTATEQTEDSAVAEEITIETVSGEGYQLNDAATSGTCGDNLTWTLENGVLTISGTGDMKDYSLGNAPWYSYRTSIISVVIGDSVTSIGTYVFYSCTALTSVTIPDSVTSIGTYAFRGCTSLTSVTIPDSVTNIGDDGFNGCTNLTAVTLGSGLTSCTGFSGCTSLASITIPDGVTSIDSSAFYGCTSLASIKIPDGVVSIGNAAFNGCTGLASITIPDSVTKIEGYAFQGCSSLASVSIPDSVTSIGDMAFCGCTSLASVKIGSGVISIGEGVFQSCSNLAQIVIPDNVVSISRAAFYNCSNLASITIGDSVTSIGERAFSSCSNLSNIAFGNSVTSIGAYAFEACTSLSNVTIPTSMTSIGTNAFANCTGLTNITIPDSVVSIGASAFYYCCNLTSVTIPDSVISIGGSAFIYCTSLEYIVIPVGVVSIGGSAFSSCTNLADIYYAGSEDEWAAISIGSNNDYLTGATIHYNSTGPEENTGATSPSGFQLGVDNNSFLHYNDSSVYANSGFDGISTYAIDSVYFKKLASFATSGEINELKKTMFSTWGGECHGIAVTMGLLYEGYLNLDDLCQLTSGVSSYYTMQNPCDDIVLRNNILYYHLLQYIDASSNSTLAVSETRDNSFLTGLANRIYGYDSLPVFLEKLVSYASKGDVLLLGYDSSHTVLVVGCTYDADANEYSIEIYDENSVLPSNTTGSFSYMTVAGDYSSFSYGSTLSTNNYSSMFFTELSSYQDFLYSDTANTGVVSNANATLVFPSDTAFTIVSADGRNLTYDGSSFSGDIPVYSIDTISSDNTASGTDVIYMVEIENNSDFNLTALSNNFDISIYSDADYLSLAGTDIDSALFSFENGIDIHGEEYTFEAYVSTDEQISGNETGLISISASASSDVSIEKNGDMVSVSSEEELQDVTTASYVGVEVIEETYENAVSEITASSSDLHEYTYSDNGDGTHTAVCRNCGDNYTESHTYVDGICSLCGAATSSETVHAHSYTSEVTKTATCTTDGVMTYTCSCGDSYTETIPATGNHTWNDGVVTTAATHTTTGVKTYTCTVCGATKTETIAATGHTWNSGTVTTPATRYTTGVKTYTCSCGASYTETIAKTGATFLFTDVTNTAASYYTPVYWAYDYGITKGTSATAFSPSATCTRAQFVTFLWRLAGEPEPSSGNNPFTDVTNTSASYYKAVLWAVEQGVTKGTSATTFSPSQTITRAQAVTFLYRYAGEPAVSASSSFTDVTNTSASYYKAVIWAVEKGITNGTTSTTFSPSNPCTRGQMVTFLYRFAVEPLTT